MWSKVVVFFLIFSLLVLPTVFAAGELESLDAPSRYLSAEAQKSLRDGFERLNTDLKMYQDENFQALDTQIRAYEHDLMLKVILGSLGAVLVGGALVAILMYRVTKKYSVQDFESKVRVMDTAQQQAQAEQWQMPVQESIGTEYGQRFAGNHSAFNNWQAQSPYHGGWSMPAPVQQAPQQAPPQDWSDWNNFGGGNNG